MMEKNGAITDQTPDVKRERRPDKELKKDAQIRDASRTLKDEHKKPKRS